MFTDSSSHLFEAETHPNDNKSLAIRLVFPINQSELYVDWHLENLIDSYGIELFVLESYLARKQYFGNGFFL